MADVRIHHERYMRAVQASATANAALNRARAALSQAIRDGDTPRIQSSIKALDVAITRARRAATLLSVMSARVVAARFVRNRNSEIADHARSLTIRVLVERDSEHVTGATGVDVDDVARL